MAAGKGKRLKSRTPKVLHPICGRPVLWHVLQATRAVRPEVVAVVVGHGRDEVQEAVESWDLPLPIRFVHQEQPQGTGHAVMSAEDAIRGAEDVLVLSGDEPLVTGAQLRDLLRLHRRRKAAAAIQTTVPEDPTGFGRIVREGDDFLRIAESVEATAAERAITEVATGTYAFRRDDLFKALPLVSRDNVQREYYLPDVLAILREKGEVIVVVRADNGGAVGANSRLEMARATAVMRRRINEDLMEHGVTLVNPNATYLDAGVRIGSDSVIHPNTSLLGETRIGHGCVIGPSARVVDSRIDDGAEVRESVVTGSRIGKEASVGPYAHIRPGTVLGPRAKAGSFVEIKASRIGEGSKVPHLSYVGDAVIGRNVNIGAGTVTVNYDGYGKHRTVIGDDVRIGSDTMLVAPVRVGKGAVTGAGSTITRDVPPGSLAVERAEQRVVRGYRARKDAAMRGEKDAGRRGKR
jgi:bifunctional UDP-N-acetylglucosamine pyrophosphorylase / glucosamine-1-phosphate N-acetyltransferase